MTENAAVVEFQARVTWALGRLVERLNPNRAEDGAAGTAKPHVERDANAPMSAMAIMASRLALSPVEIDALWILVCLELDADVASCMHSLSGSPEMNAQLLERLVASGGAFEVRPFEHLVALGLVHIVGEPRTPSARRLVRVDERVVDLARGEFALDRSLRGIASLVSAIEVRQRTSGLDIAVPSSIARSLASPTEVAVLATGPEGSGRTTLLCHAVSAQGRGCLVVDTSELSTDPNAFQRELRAIVRECRLHAAWPVFRDGDNSEAARAQSDAAGAGAMRSTAVAMRTGIERAMRDSADLPLLITMREAPPWQTARTVVTVELIAPSAATRAAAWQRALPGLPDAVRDDLAQRYPITPGVLQRCAAAARSAVADVAQLDVIHVQEVLRVQLEQKLSRLARRVETRQVWDDLVLPLDQMDLLIELVARVRHRKHVLERWGFADKIGRGLGLATLLSGPPGTGKTMIAGLLARELGLDLYQVDLASIVSKYIGETEKQLAALFDAAEAGHAILLFDEADSLFAKRTEVRSSNDRYANLEVNYLLQRIEAFSGIALLTTNHETAIDPAFLRRLAFHIRVPMPDERERELLWRAMIPAKADRADDLCFERLASEFVMSGGYIRNAVLRAAFLSANDGGIITSAQLLRGARAEYEAMGKVAFQRTLRHGFES